MDNVNSEQQTQPQAEPQGAPQPQAEQQQDKLLTFTQAQMSALMSREKHEGKDSVYRALGLDPKDTAGIEQARAKLTPQQQAQAQPVSDKQEQAQQPTPPQAKANDSVIRAEAKVTLLMAGVQPELLDDALTLVLSKVEKQEQVTAEVDALKAKHAVLFAPQKQTTGQLVGGVGAGAGQASTTAADFGAQLARAKNANKSAQQQFFGGGNKR
jgi:hypothetical protein